MFRRGRRLFTTASILLLVVAAMHATSHFAPPPVEARIVAAEEAMRQATMDLGFGMVPSVHDIFTSLSVTMSLTLAIWAVTNLIVASGDPTGRIVGRLAWWSTIGIGALVVLFGWLRIPPPLITLGVVGVVYLAAALTHKNR
jgi:hypothetical protein